MSAISFNQIPIDMKTQLNNTLAIKKKNKEILSYVLTYTYQEISKNYPQSYKSICEVNILYDNKPPYKLRMHSDAFSNKADADRQSAFLCYNQIIYDIKKNQLSIDSYDNKTIFESIEPSTNQQSSLSDKQEIYPLLPVMLPNYNYPFVIYILIDIENKPNTKSIEDIASQYDNVMVLKFVGVNHPNRKKGNIIVKSNYQDAADHAISLYTGGIIQSIEVKTNIIIYTGDRFGSALQEFSDFELVNVYHMAHSEDVIEHLNSFNYNDTVIGKILIDN